MENLKKFIEEFTNQKDIDFPYENVVILGKEYFFTNKNAKELSEEIKLTLNSIGIFLGIQKRKFEPSMALITMLNKFSENKIIINNKSAWLFACKRDIFEENVIEKSGFANLFLVLNQKKEVFGYAIRKKERGKIIYNNILDIGNYLRREMK